VYEKYDVLAVLPCWFLCAFRGYAMRQVEDDAKKQEAR